MSNFEEYIDDLLDDQCNTIGCLEKPHLLMAEQYARAERDLEYRLNQIQIFTYEYSIEVRDLALTYDKKGYTVWRMNVPNYMNWSLYEPSASELMIRKEQEEYVERKIREEAELFKRTYQMGLIIQHVLERYTMG